MRRRIDWRRRETPSESNFFVQDILDVDDPNSDPNQLDDGGKKNKIYPQYFQSSKAGRE